MLAQFETPLRTFGLLAALTLGASSCGRAAESTGVVGVQFSAVDGSATSVEDFEGTPLVINMWASNCVPCLEEMPAFDEVATEAAGQVAIIGVNVFDDAATATQYAADRGVTYPQFQDEDGSLSTALEVTGLPATAFFAADGTLLDVHQGAYTADGLRAAIAKHFSELLEGQT